MKRIGKYLGCAMMLAAITCGNAMAKGVVTKVYMFGFAASFNDSIVHFTDIQQVDSAWTNTKSKFLLGRNNYSYQLRDYLAESQNLPHRTCMVIYGTDRTKLEKKYQKMRQLYTEKAKGQYDVRDLNSASFQFMAVDASDQTDADEQQPKKKKDKQKKRDGKQRPPQGRPQGNGPQGPPPSRS